MRRKFQINSATVLTAMGIAACGGGGGDAAGDADTGGGDAPAAAAPVDATTVGAISGMVSFTGTPPARTAIDMADEADCAAAYGGAGPMSQNVLVSNGGLANVLVSVDFTGSAPAPSGSSPVLDQVNCRYVPHVLGLQAGQEVTVTTQDAFLHNVNMSQAVNNRMPNFGLPRAGMTRNVRVSAAEAPFPVRCDVHGWMTAYIGVFDHPYFAVSGPNGRFSIPNVPAGQYGMTAWHEEYGTMTGSVTVTAQGTAEVSFAYSAGMAGADVPLGEPLVLRHGADGVQVIRGQ